MATLSERAKLLRGEIGQQLSALVGAIIRRNVSEQEQLEAALVALIEQALLAEHKLAMATAISLAERERVEDVSSEDEAYNAAIEHVKLALRAAAEKEV